ncbi:hypothetical protein PSAC2689_30349 [Paraburkholderia sacchari]
MIGYGCSNVPQLTLRCVLHGSSASIFHLESSASHYAHHVERTGAPFSESSVASRSDPITFEIVSQKRQGNWELQDRLAPVSGAMHVSTPISKLG